ncbi:MAG: AI-2E family transporter [Pseudomonadota bacterium]
MSNDRAGGFRGERQLLIWLVLGLLFSLAVLALSEVLLPFVAGMVIAYALNPIADRLTALGLPRIVAAASVILVVVMLLVLVLVFVLPLAAAQVQQLVATLPGELERLRLAFETWARAQLGENFTSFEVGLDQGLAELSKNWAQIASYVAQSIWSQGRTIIEVVAVLLIAPLVAFYVLVDWHPMMERLGTLVPRDHEDTLRQIVTDIDKRIAAFIRGQGLVCLILGTYYVIALSAAGLKYGLLVGIMTGVMTFVPFVGWALGLITASSLAIVQSWPDYGLLLAVIAIFAGAQALDAGVLAPNIVGSKIGLHPVWLIFALMVFSYLFGIVGVLVAVPLAAAMGVLVRFALKIYLGSRLYQGRFGTGDIVASGDQSRDGSA